VEWSAKIVWTTALINDIRQERLIISSSMIGTSAISKIVTFIFQSNSIRQT